MTFISSQDLSIKQYFLEYRNRLIVRFLLLILTANEVIY